VPATWRAEGLKEAPHGLELLYVFGDYDNKTGWWDMTFMMASMTPGGALKTKNPGLTGTDKYVSESMMKMWAQFAATGTPDVKGPIAWPVYTAGNDKYLYIDEKLEVKAGFSLIGQKK
jgi:carboxylesterase type B